MMKAANRDAFNVLNFRGRAGRLEFSALFAVWVVWVTLRSVLTDAGEWGLILGIGLTVSTALVLCCIRRLHDLGQSGWWALLAFVPFVNCCLFLWLAATPGKDATSANDLEVS